MAIRTGTILSLLVLGLGPALAEDSKPTSIEKEKQTLESFAAANQNCREWTDGCMVCMRHDPHTYACSLPGIACQPTTLSCRDSPADNSDAKTPTASPK